MEGETEVVLTGFDTSRDIVQTMVSIFGVAAIWVATISYFVTQKQSNFNVIVSCVTRFLRQL